MLFSFWILKMLVQYKEATSSSFASCVTYSEYVTHEAFSPLEGGLVIFKMLFWLVLPRDCNWLIKRKLLGVRRIYKERRWEKKCQGHLWHLLESLGAKQIATVQNTGPLSEFQIEWHHAPGGCNYLDICWVITAAIRWFLNYVVDSFMRQWVKTQPEVKSFWPGLRTGWGGAVPPRIKGPQRAGCRSDSRDEGWYSCWNRGVFEANTFTEQVSLTVSKSRQTKNQCICGKSWWVTATAFLVGEDLSVNSDFQEVYEDWGK